MRNRGRVRVTWRCSIPDVRRKTIRPIVRSSPRLEPQMAVPHHPDVDRYLDGLPDDRRETARAVVTAIRESIPDGFQEAMTWGWPTWEVPLERYPDTYNGKPLMYASFAVQKRHYAVYLTTPYLSSEVLTRLREGFAEAEKKLDMGKSCVRFTRLEKLPIAVIRETIGAVGVDEFIRMSEEARAGAGGR